MPLDVFIEEYARGTLRDPLQHFRRRQRRECTVCGFSGYFLSAGPRPEARCPSCASKERDRIMGLYLRREGIDLSRARVLHFSPERSFHRIWRDNPDYVSGDVKRSKVANAVVDITDIGFPDGSFDALICHHVLEHVPDDARGMRECRRVLREGGIAFFSVPQDLDRAETWERPADMPVAAFEKIVGWDHKRLYGRDFADRLAAAGFRVAEIGFSDAEAERHRLRFPGLDRIHVCTTG